MLINALFVKSTKEIIYSRCRNDYISSSDDTVSIDGGFEYSRIIGEPDNYIEIKLNSDVLLEHILSYDSYYKNTNADKFPDGYYGRFKLVHNSNLEFYKRLVVDFDKIKEELQCLH